MQDLDVDLVRTFVAIAEEGSFTGAGQRLHKTQSTVSLQLKRLERRMGLRLLHRTQGRIRDLTPAGKILLENAHDLLRVHDQTIASLNLRQISGAIHLGLSDETAHHSLSHALARLQAYHPLVELEVTCASSGELEEWVSMGRMDLALVNRCNGIVSDNIAIHTLYEEKLTWAMHQNMSWQEGQTLPLVCFPHGCGYRARAMQALEANGVSWRNVYTSASRQGIWSAVTAGLGIAALPASSIPVEAPDIITGATTKLPTLESVNVAIISDETRERVELLELLRTFIQQQFAA
ncbi:LysR family transcriptional regulator [Chromohalobacter sp.]|uniref:LysR family transcriptional regulator n=1 Tax=Chromohalobacter sp. TaxID=50740 RepID=UPI001DC2006F|nr:LysR family transcriptional regulator [Chromohalobacter sp.]NQY46049.1 LysR family transcriptional regulator [Chromohalobacter sp.]